MPLPLRLAVITLAAGAFACSEPERVRPNIVLVSIDSLRSDHLGCYGYARATSPTLDLLAAEGARFENAVSTTSWTLPAHAAMFTGLYDSAHGLIDNGLRLAPEIRTLAEQLKETGYHTAGFFGGPYLHPTFGLGDGFEHYQSCMTTVPDELSEEDLRRESRAPAGKSHDDITGPRTLEEVSQWSAKRPTDRPFFLFVHLWDVHYDFIPPPPYDTMFDPDYDGPIDGREFMSRPDVSPQMSARDLAHVKALYDGEIRFTDEIVKQILARLREQGMLDDTLVIITADHGEEFFEHGNKGHQRTLFDEVLRVPLIVHWPARIEAGRVIEDQVRLIDIAPTVLAAAGARDLPPMQGRDILPLALGRRLEPVPALAELNADRREFRALRTLDFKVINYGRRPDGADLPTMGFDLAKDPGEQKPLRPGGGTTLDAQKEILEKTREASFALHKYIGARSQAIDIDPELEKKLRAMGYFGDAPKDR